MLKWFNKKKKDNKGFTLVELIIVVAILAILVGLLAPQYTKYVERSRRAADAANLDSLVTAVKVATADQTYNKILPESPVEIVITIKEAGTTVTYNKTDVTTGLNGTDTATTALATAFKEYVGNAWDKTNLKSKAWGETGISAVCTIHPSGSMDVVYSPVNFKNFVKEGK